jgi:hypothetical protein
VTTPLPPALAALLQARPTAGESLLGAGAGPSRLPATAVVLASTRQGALIESAGNRWLMRGAPPLPQGATLTLEHAAAGVAPQPARLLAIGTRAVAPPVAVRLQPAVSRPSAPPPAESPPRGGGVQAEARVIGAAGRPLGPPVAITLAATLPAIPEATRPLPSASARAAAAPPTATALAGAPIALAGQPAPPLPGAQPPPQSGAGTVVPAEVVARDPHGRLLLHSGTLRLRLETPLDLPLGARLALALPQGLPPPSGALPAPDADPVQRLIAALLQPASTDGEVRETGGLRLPAADHTLAARLLRWVQALAAPPSAEPGESAPADGPEAASEPLRLAILELARQAREPQPGGWRVLVMPLGVEDPQILKIHLREPDADPEREARPGRAWTDTMQRAVFEIQLSHLGRCQLDVLCQGERLDLVVRSAARLEPAVEEHIRGVIAATRAAAGLAGRLEFRAAELLTLPDPLQPAGRDVVV